MWICLAVLVSAGISEQNKFDEAAVLSIVIPIALYGRIFIGVLTVFLKEKCFVFFLGKTTVLKNLQTSDPRRGQKIPSELFFVEFADSNFTLTNRV